ncbi:MAG: AAA family ATPase [Candidatus Aenigmarchaeota archaeon]|nr:AAA family ATPase [Candidatus Aenigmarchaeota archaeon]
MYKKIKINGFRGIKELEVTDFKQFNLFVGENNCGKTTILESLYLITGPTNALLPTRINSFRNMNRIDETSFSVLFNELNIDSNIEISAVLDKPKEERNLTIKSNKKQTVRFVQNNYEEAKIEVSDTSKPKINGLILEYSLKKGTKKPLKKITNIIIEGVEPKITVLKNYKETLMGSFINETTYRNVSKIFNNIQIRKQTNKIVNILRKIEPSLKEIVLGSEDILYCDFGLNKLVPINVMGDGIVRILTIISTIADMQDGIVFIDEIENGLYPLSQNILWSAIFESAKEFNVQIFATTHSIECINAFCSSYSKIKNSEDDIRLYRIERKNNNLKAVNYNHKVLKASLEKEWEIR